jgi:hypothetical protein
MTWYAWQESGGPVHKADPTEAEIAPVRAVTQCGEKVDRNQGWRLSETRPARQDCPRCF